MTLASCISAPDISYSNGGCLHNGHITPILESSSFENYYRNALNRSVTSCSAALQVYVTTVKTTLILAYLIWCTSTKTAGYNWVFQQVISYLVLNY